ncbi:MAG TPA: PCP reductase family protein [Nitrospiria bacterium]|nr:PCP reductase family protein [Nitrospiria bacterium]
MEEKREITWDDEAKIRLEKAPAVLRGMVKRLTEKRATEMGCQVVTSDILSKIRAGLMGSTGDTHAPMISWTDDAKKELDNIPDFLKDIVMRIAEETAISTGLETVDISLLDRLSANTEESHEGRSESLPWSDSARDLIKKRIEKIPDIAAESVKSMLIKEAEDWARARGTNEITEKGLLQSWTDSSRSPVEWSEEALRRLEKAPDFVRNGIRKAAEKRTRGIGAKIITSEMLTSFRNDAMMKAVKRIKRFGHKELTFDAFDTAIKNMKKLQTPVARKRLSDIREYVTKKGKIGLIDKGILDRMKGYLKDEADDEGHND